MHRARLLVQVLRRGQCRHGGNDIGGREGRIGGNCRWFADGVGKTLQPAQPASAGAGEAPPADTQRLNSARVDP
jgi:hypothetical protein